jgi:hypothetical protein
MKLPDDKQPEPEGGRAAERLREFKRQRSPQDPGSEQQEAEPSKKQETQQLPSELAQKPDSEGSNL